MNALVACIYRQPSLPTMRMLLEVATAPRPWYLFFETGDALISRARSTAASQWLLTRPDDDVLVMTDDDFYTTVDELEAVAALAREKRGIAAGVTPLRSGEYTAIVPLVPSADEPWRDRHTEAREIRWAGGLLAYHRSVFETLARTLPLLHQGDSIPCFWPFFAPAIQSGLYLSEDYACHERARQAGFTVWVQPACQVQHQAEILVSSRNLEHVFALGRSAEIVVGSAQEDPSCARSSTAVLQE